MIIAPELILTDLAAASAEEVIHALGERLAQHGCTDAAYTDKVIARERTHPTGLPTNPPIAIPHAEAGLSARPGIAVGLLAQPVPFGVMGTDDQTTEAAFVFMLAVTDPAAQVVWLKSLIEFVQQPANLVVLGQLRGQPPQHTADFLRRALNLPEG